MTKQLNSQRYVFKIKSEYIINNQMEIELDVKKARETEQLVQLGSSQLIRFVDEINGDFTEDEVIELKEKIKKLKKKEYSPENKSNLYKLMIEKDNLLLVDDIVMVVMNKKNYRKLKKGFMLNGKKFVRLQSTSGGVKKGVIFYCSEKLYKELDKRIDNGRDMTKAFVPAKLSAYRGLVCSASSPVSDPIGKVLVVHDVENTIYTDVILLKDGIDSVEPVREFVDDYEMVVNTTDGLGLVTYNQAKKWSEDLGLDYVSGGFVARNSFIKGMLYPFPIQEFAEEVAGSYTVKDVWGNEIDIREVSIILTTSQLKLWDSYDSWDHFESCCKENGYTWSITKQIPKELDDERCSNYQFLQGLELSDEDISELIKPTVQHIEDIVRLNPLKTALFTNGGKDIKGVNDVFNDVTKALIIDPNVINDKYIRGKIIEDKKGFVEDAKLGRLVFNSNYQTASGDVYMLMESIFEMKPKGLLNAGEFYSSYWIDKGVNEVAIFRAPQISISNSNVVKIVNDEEKSKWYRYMINVFICNAYDDTMARLSGMDFDADSVYSTDNKTIIKGIPKTRPLVCEQKSAIKRIPTENMYIEADMQSFGDEIGTITNKASAMYELMATFEKDSREYKELEYRLQCCQKLQQDQIDLSKGISVTKPPSHWFKVDACDNEFDLSICVGKKKPYYFIYNYDYVKKKHRVFEERINIMSYIRTGLNAKTVMENADVECFSNINPSRFVNESPVYNNQTVMNKIAHKLEEEFQDMMNKRISYEDFDYTVYMNKNIQVNKDVKKELEMLYKESKKEQIKYHSSKNFYDVNGEKDSASERTQKLVEYFKEEAFKICNNEDELCNAIVEICYSKKNSSKQFAWSVCGKTMLKNLYNNTGNKQYIITKDHNGELEYVGKKYKVEVVSE